MKISLAIFLFVVVVGLGAIYQFFSFCLWFFSVFYILCKFSQKRKENNLKIWSLFIAYTHTHVPHHITLFARKNKMNACYFLFFRKFFFCILSIKKGTFSFALSSKLKPFVSHLAIIVWMKNIKIKYKCDFVSMLVVVVYRKDTQLSLFTLNCECLSLLQEINVSKVVKGDWMEIL